MDALVILFVILLLATFWDYKHGKIPNYLILTGIVFGMIRLMVREDIFDIVKYIPGIILPIFLFYPVYKVGGIGAGDIKLFSVLGFYFPFMQSMFCIFTSLFLAALLSLIKMAYYQNFTERIEYLISYIKDSIILGKFHYYHKDSSTYSKTERSQIHLAFPIFLGVLVAGGII